MDTIILN